jgi:hypothetical protein
VVDPVVLYNSTVRLVIVMLLCAAACFCGVGLVCSSFCCFGTVHNCCAQSPVPMYTNRVQPNDEVDAVCRQLSCPKLRVG